MPRWVFVIVLLAMLGPLMRMMSRGWGDNWRPGRRRRRELEREAGLEQAMGRALAERDTVIEDLQARISELESRLDFTERLLAARTEPEAAASTRRP